MLHIPNYNLAIGPEEAASLKAWDVIINVNDIRPKLLDPVPAKLFWYPILETQPWGYNPFFFTKRLLDHYTEKYNVLIHCSDGKHRAPMMVYGWLLSKGFDARRIDYMLRYEATKQWTTDIANQIIPENIRDFYHMMSIRKNWGIKHIVDELARRPKIEH